MIYTKQNKNNCLRNDIFNMQIISVKSLLFRININKSSVHNIVVGKERYYPFITKTEGFILNIGVHIERSYLFILNARRATRRTKIIIIIIIITKYK